jgi:hypothetical protein
MSETIPLKGIGGHPVGGYTTEKVLKNIGHAWKEAVRPTLSGAWDAAQGALHRHSARVQARQNIQAGNFQALSDTVALGDLTMGDAVNIMAKNLGHVTQEGAATLRNPDPQAYLEAVQGTLTGLARKASGDWGAFGPAQKLSDAVRKLTTEAERETLSARVTEGLENNPDDPTLATLGGALSDASASAATAGARSQIVSPSPR